MSTRSSDAPHAQTVPVEPTDPLVGLRLNDRYEMREPLGRGGMATAYLAYDLEARQKVVVKVPRSDLSREIAESMQLIERFEREAGAQAKLEHAHIVRIRGRGHVELEGVQRPYVVVDYKGGGDLEARLRAGPQTVTEVLEWLVPIAQALDFSHRSDWLHRDIKPDNILFDNEGFVYLSDFGIAKLLETGVQTGAGPGSDGGGPRTQLGHVIGTPGYFPPEAMLGELTPAYDQYSLAVVVAQALSGGKPSAESTTSGPDAMLAPIARGPSAVLRRALSARSEDRFANCVEFAEALRRAGERVPRWPGRALSAGVTALTLVLIAWAVSSTFDRQPEPGSAPQAEADSATQPEVLEPSPADAPSAPVLKPALRRFEVGSTAREQQAALELCRRHIGDACNPAWYASETRRVVELSPYELDTREVTVAEFRRFIGNRRTQAEDGASHKVVAGLGTLRVSGLSWHSPGWEPAEDEPVVHVSRAEAAAFCADQGKRLPTEVEWEAYARGSLRSVFPWGDAWDGSRARWLGSESVRGPAPVAQFPPAPNGSFDLAGNVWEWTAPLPGPENSGAEAVLKGGSWAEANPASLRAATRMVVDADYSSEDAGFRCLRETDVFSSEADS